MKEGYVGRCAPNPATEALLLSLYFAKRMQLPSSMVVAAASTLHAHLHNKWVSRPIGFPDHVTCDRMVKECDDCIFRCQTMFGAPVAQVLACAPPEVKRYAKHVFMLLKYRLLPGQLDVCWLIMAHIFMDGDANKARACVTRAYPNHFFRK
jgi:hypothetical protein